LACPALLGAGGCRCGLRAGSQRQGEGQGRGKHGRNQDLLHGCVSVAGAVAPSWEGALGPVPSPVPAPLNMYLPTSWIRSTAGWVNTISSPALSTSGSPPGCRPI